MVRLRFAPSPTGSLHLGNALSAVANRHFADEHGGTLLLRIDDTDQARNREGGAHEIAADLEWLGVRWDEGPVHQSSRFVRHREAAHHIGKPDAEGALRFGRTTLLRPDGTPTYQLASAVDDVDFEITHVIRGSDHRANAELQTELIRALGGDPPEFIHHGLLLGEDGTKLSKRHGAATVADLRAAGIPAEAVRAYLDELGIRSEAGASGLTGVWSDGMKLAAIGIKLNRSVVSHGFALNLTADLEYFAGIIPCGHADLRPTSVEALTGARVDTESAARAYAPHFAEAFGVELAGAAADRLRPVSPAS